ncbi:MAG TPA: YfbM family protein [Gemmataceae bacterium]|jgi:hypothetical protein|nr:YfbM family protein [Gemmataceae bacterium]
MICSLYAVTPAEMQRLLAEPEEVWGFAGTANRPCLSLQKAWDGLHFLLTGSATGGEEPLGFLLQGGEAVGNFDPVYSPGARVFAPDATRRLDMLLSAMSDEQLWRRFDAAKMEAEEIYPDIWDEPEEHLREWYLGFFRDMKAFIHEASESQKALLVLIA